MPCIKSLIIMVENSLSFWSCGVNFGHHFSTLYRCYEVSHFIRWLLTCQPDSLTRTSGVNLKPNCLHLETKLMTRLNYYGQISVTLMPHMVQFLLYFCSTSDSIPRAEQGQATVRCHSRCGCSPDPSFSFGCLQFCFNCSKKTPD